MKRKDLVEYLQETYSAEPDYPFPGDGDSCVFRHADSRKWFALIMNVPRSSLGLPGDGRLDILNVKCDPFLSGSMRQDPGILPAYHMNKTQWVTVLLDGTVEQSKIKTLVSMSYELTATKRRKRVPNQP